MAKESKKSAWSFSETLQKLMGPAGTPVENGEFFRPAGEAAGVGAEKSNDLKITNATNVLAKPDYQGAFYYDYVEAPSGIVPIRLVGKPENIKNYVQASFENQLKSVEGKANYEGWARQLGFQPNAIPAPAQLAEYVLNGPKTFKYNKAMIDRVAQLEAEGGQISPSEPQLQRLYHLRAAGRQAAANKPEPDLSAGVQAYEQLTHVKGRIPKGAGGKRAAAETGKTREGPGKDKNLLERVLWAQDPTEAKRREYWYDVSKDASKGKLTGNPRASGTTVPYSAVVADQVNWLVVPYLKIAAKNDATGLQNFRTALRTLVTNAASSQDPVIRNLQGTLQAYANRADSMVAKGATTMAPTAISSMGLVPTAIQLPQAAQPRVSPVLEAKMGQAPAMPAFAQAASPATYTSPVFAPTRPAGFQTPGAATPFQPLAGSQSVPVYPPAGGAPAFVPSFPPAGGAPASMAQVAAQSPGASVVL